jgi:hypothetical protein
MKRVRLTAESLLAKQKALTALSCLTQKDVYEAFSQPDDHQLDVTREWTIDDWDAMRAQCLAAGRTLPLAAHLVFKFLLCANDFARLYRQLDPRNQQRFCKTAGLTHDQVNFFSFLRLNVGLYEIDDSLADLWKHDVVGYFFATDKDTRNVFLDRYNEREIDWYNNLPDEDKLRQVLFTRLF